MHCNRRDGKVVPYGQILPCQLRQAFAEAAVVLGNMQFLKQTGCSGVVYRGAQDVGAVAVSGSRPARVGQIGAPLYTSQRSLRRSRQPTIEESGMTLIDKDSYKVDIALVGWPTR